jgi:hypothetical protein
MDEQVVRSRRPARWGRALLLGAIGGALLLLALGCAYGADLHHGVGVAACQARPAPDGFPPEGIRVAHRTLVPLGTACEFVVRSGRSVLSPESDWRATWFAVGGSVFLAGAVVSLAVRRRYRAAGLGVR